MRAGGPTQRQLRVGEVVRRALSDVLMRGDLHGADLSGLSITVGEVRVSPDLRHAVVYVMPLGGRERERTLSELTRARGELRHLLTRAMETKTVPELRFEIDESFDRIEETERMFRGIRAED
ncbi:MAG: 30S ribosome-binding factor RbfA [Paracoccaceae bacterium]